MTNSVSFREISEKAGEVGEKVAELAMGHLETNVTRAERLMTSVGLPSGDEMDASDNELAKAAYVGALGVLGAAFLLAPISGFLKGK